MRGRIVHPDPYGTTLPDDTLDALTPAQEARLRLLEVAGDVIRSQDLKIGRDRLGAHALNMARDFERWVRAAS